MGCSAFSTAVRSFVIDVLQPSCEARQRTVCCSMACRLKSSMWSSYVCIAVKRRASRMNFVEIGEIVVDEMMKWLGRTHHLGSSSNPCSVIPNSDNPQWYNTLVGSSPTLHRIMPGSLYVVSTPIGNLDDITVRAINTLKSVGLVAAEDTRRTGTAPAPFRNHHAHDQPPRTQRTEKIPAAAAEARRRRGHRARVRRRHAAGLPIPVSGSSPRPSKQGIGVVPIPGASAVLAALAASGYPAESLSLPASRHLGLKTENVACSACSKSPEPSFSSKPHIESRQTLADMAEILGDRPITIARELTKLHESVVRHHRARQLSAARYPNEVNSRSCSAPYAKPHDEPRNVSMMSELECVFLSNDRYQQNCPVARRSSPQREKFGLSPNEVYARLERLKASGPS